MTATSVAQAVYVLAAVLFVLSLAGLSKQESARRGNVLGMVGMVLALAATIVLAFGTSARPCSSPRCSSPSCSSWAPPSGRGGPAASR